ncbi:hypothetical protein PROFUN_08338 [Planoprotostelium fungivorum]|uniref:PDZ GRASP-type domain-containing protein n=1 Tax=Planoprotostelium fungivorum TaxID=1890364 RepID=A0A2P6NI52_9EUKA|nr:hypothetical protein PROFUN_08338 [Planoprotostelium fungivorum]
MGNEQSTPAQGGSSIGGFHVLQVQDGSPGAAAGLESYFDFITGANGKAYEREDPSFVETLRQNIHKPVDLTVYNSKNDTIRNVTLVPNDTWGGSGLAGISIRYCTVEVATEFVWHVLEVHDKSPASKAGLVANTDYIVGTPDQQFNNSEDFYTLIQNNEEKSIVLYVYSTQQERMRQVQITPNSDWGGEGSMGCDVGFGLLHRIPVHTTSTGIQRRNYNSTSVLVPEYPAIMQSLPNKPEASNSAPGTPSPVENGPAVLPVQAVEPAEVLAGTASPPLSSPPLASPPATPKRDTPAPLHSPFAKKEEEKTEDRIVSEEEAVAAVTQSLEETKTNAGVFAPSSDVLRVATRTDTKYPPLKAHRTPLGRFDKGTTEPSIDSSAGSCFHLFIFQPTNIFHMKSVAILLALLALAYAVTPAVQEVAKRDGGVITYYNCESGQQGSCGDWLSNNDYVAAVGNAMWNSGQVWCGRQVTIQGPRGTITVTIKDSCGDACEWGHFDLCQNAFAQVANLDDGYVGINWWFS